MVRDILLAPNAVRILFRGSDQMEYQRIMVTRAQDLKSHERFAR